MDVPWPWAMTLLMVTLRMIPGAGSSGCTRAVELAAPHDVKVDGIAVSPPEPVEAPCVDGYVCNHVVITNSNRGLAFMVFDGGIVEDVVIANVTIDTRRFDWFWWGDGDPIHFNIMRRSELDGRVYSDEPAPGIIRNVTISNVIAHGQGTSMMQGHPDSWLQGIRLNHVRLFVSHGAEAPYESTAAAMTLKYARDVEMKDVEIRWEEPRAATWQSGLVVDTVQDLILEGTSIDAAPGSVQPVLRLHDVDGVLVRQSRVSSVDVSGVKSRAVRLLNTESKITSGPGVEPVTLK